MKLNKRLMFSLLFATISLFFVLCICNKDDVVCEDVNEVQKNISSQNSTNNIIAYGVFIDSNEICVVENEEDAQNLVNELFLKARRFYKMNEGCTYLNNVEIIQGSYSRDKVNTSAEALEILGINEIMGEPCVATSDGEKIVISLCGVALEEKYVDVDFETKYRFTYGVTTEYEKVLHQGEKGLVKQIHEIQTVNGKVVFDKMIIENTVSEPTAHVVEIGVTPSMQLLNSEMAFFIKPYDGVITSDYGYRYLGGYEFHTGIDLASGNKGCYGDDVVAAADGVVVEAGYTSGKGNYVVIKHDFGFSTLYAHFKEILVRVGDTVSAGDTVGTIGASGRVTGPHLHFEIRLNGEHTNPENYLKFE